MIGNFYQSGHYIGEIVEANGLQQEGYRIEWYYIRQHMHGMHTPQKANDPRTLEYKNEIYELTTVGHNTVYKVDDLNHFKIIQAEDIKRGRKELRIMGDGMMVDYLKESTKFKEILSNLGLELV
jgi:hypothetical protein